jgi:hypothetical protein
MERPRVKLVHYPVRLKNGDIRIGTTQFGVGSIVSGDSDGTVWKMIGYMDGKRTRQQILDTCMSNLQGIEISDLESILDSLIESGFVEEGLVTTSDTLSSSELIRYSRNIEYFSWIDTKKRSSRFVLQERLKEASVTVVGMGGMLAPGFRTTNKVG